MKELLFEGSAAAVNNLIKAERVTFEYKTEEKS